MRLFVRNANRVSDRYFTLEIGVCDDDVDDEETTDGKFMCTISIIQCLSIFSTNKKETETSICLFNEFEYPK